MKKAVIAGAAGFLGSHLVKRLLDKNYVVIGLDNLSTGKRGNLDAFLTNENFTFIEQDIASETVLNLAVLDGVDEIYHLASPASPKFYQKDPLGTISVNTIGTKHMLDLAKHNGSKLLFTSTSEVYGDPTQHPQSEQYLGNVNTWGPRACYDESKRLGETYCYEYYHLYHVPVRIARIFNTYSASLRNDDGRVISNFVTQALLGQDITVYGDGLQTRTFCYVDDTINGLLKMMESENATGEIINIGNTNECTILELAKLVKQLTDSESKIVFKPLPQDDPKERRPFIEKAKKLLDWEPKIDLEQGLVRTIDSYQKQLKLQ